MARLSEKCERLAASLAGVSEQLLQSKASEAEAAQKQKQAEHETAALRDDVAKLRAELDRCRAASDGSNNSSNGTKYATSAMHSARTTGPFSLIMCVAWPHRQGAALVASMAEARVGLELRKLQAELTLARAVVSHPEDYLLSE